MMLQLKLQYFGHLMRRVDSLEKTLMLGGIEGRRRRGQQRMRWLDGITDLMDVSEWTPGVGDGQGGLAGCNSWGCKELDMTEWLNWTELNWAWRQDRGWQDLFGGRNFCFRSKGWEWRATHFREKCSPQTSATLCDAEGPTWACQQCVRKGAWCVGAGCSEKPQPQRLPVMLKVATWTWRECVCQLR